MIRFLIASFLSFSFALHAWGSDERYETLQLILEDRKVMLEAVRKHHNEVEKELQQLMLELQTIQQKKRGSRGQAQQELEQQENATLFKLVNRTAYRDRVKKKIYELRFEIEELSQMIQGHDSE